MHHSQHHSGYGPPPGGFGPPPGVGSYGPPPPPPARTDSLAVIGLVSSILGLVGGLINLLSGFMGACCVLCTLGSTAIGLVVLVPAALGAALSATSLSRINASPDQLEGKGLAVAGLVIGIVAATLAVAEIVLPWFGIACFAATSGSGGGP